MIRQSRPDVLDLIPGARSRSRSQSISSDTAFSTSAPGSSMAAPLAGVSPEAAYIAASAATQIVTSDHESFFQTLCSEGIVKPGPPTIHVTPDALKLVNQFLDYLLWSVLTVGKSTTLKSLRPAVVEVLKSRLAREAIASAEAELEEYLGEADEDELEHKLADGEDFDVEKCWKKARLRCMIYSSLGDLEEDDEDAYSDSDYPSSPFAASSAPTVVSPAVAIFLTSILEFIGEQTLLVAGHATVARFSQARIAAAAEEGPDGPFDAVDRPSVEELDMEKVALNPVLGRMWRQWKKMLRGGGTGQTTSRAPSIRRDSRRQSTISNMSIQSVLESKAAEHGKVSPESRDLSSRIPDTEHISPIEEPSPSNTKTLPLRRLASAEVLGSAPLTPIPETPRNADRNSSIKLPIPELEIPKNDALTEIPEFPRPNSMINLPSNTSPFIFPFSKPEVKDFADMNANETIPQRPQPRRARSKSLPLPGSFPFTPEEVDLSLAPWSTEKEEDDVPTPIPQTAPELPLSMEIEDQDAESVAETDGMATDIDDEEGDLSTVDSIVIHDTAEATAATPTFYKAQSVRIISSSTPPIGFNIPEKKSSSTINTEKGESANNQVEEGNVTPAADNVADRDSVAHAPEEIGIARTSDLFIAPVPLPTPVQSPVINQNGHASSPVEDKNSAARRPSADSASDSTPSVRDIVKERRRRSKYYIPAPAPVAPDFYPEHHTQEEIAEHYKQQEDTPEARVEEDAEPRDSHDEAPPVPPARKSPREELMELYGADPEFDEDQIPTKRATIKPTRSLRATSPLGPAHSPGLLQTSQSTHSDSSESLTARSHSSGVLGVDRRQYPSLDLPRPSSNRDVPTPTSAHGERAGLRVWTPPATPDATKGRTMRSTSFSKSKGHGHSNSISSQTSQKLKTLISGRPATADEKRHAIRNESDNDSAYSDQPAKVDEKERSFEQLINSGTTLQYTLTPDNVKRIDLEIASASSRKGSADSGKIKNGVDKYVPIVPPPVAQTAPRRSSSMKSRPLTTIASEDYEDMGVPQIPSKPPRSPRVGTPKSPNAENIRFFPPRSASSSSGTHSLPPTRGASLQPINTSANSRQLPTPASPLQSPKSAVTATVVRSPVIPQRTTANSLDEIRPLRASSSRSRLVARAPQSATADSTLALIDFFRNTPPPLNGPGPVSRPVRANPPPVTSPYKSRMDPKFNGAAATPQDSMSSINEVAPSLSSYNSQADLIKKSEAPPPVSRVVQRPQTGGAPERKQVRIRDPYAIDSDDEELFERPAPKPKRQEESLAEFLKNVPPPPEPSPSPSQQSFHQPSLKKKSSAAQLIGRFRSSSSKSNKLTKQAVSAPLEARQQPSFNGSTTSLPARKHVPLPVKMNSEDQYAPRTPNPSTPRMESMSPHPQARKPIFQARDAKAHAPDSDSSGLADFLRYTGPPVNVEPAMPVEKEETSRFKGMSFSNKKKRGIAV